MAGTTTTAELSAPFTASDDASFVQYVELWLRHRRDATAEWGLWTMATTASTSPATVSLPFGDGQYEFYTVAVDAAGNREAMPAAADASTTYELEVTKAFSFATGLAGWSGSGTYCTSQYSSADGVPPGSLSTTITGKSRRATCVWRSPSGTWQDWGVPAGATVTEVRLASAASRIAACTGCQAGHLSYRVESGSRETVASVWSGRTLPTSPEPWQTTAAQPDQAVPANWQGAGSSVRLALTASLRTGSAGSPSATLRQDEIVLVITYRTVASPDFSASLSAEGQWCPPGWICPQTVETVTLNGTGSALAGSTGAVAVQWRLHGVAQDGTVTTLGPFTAATAVDGAFNESEEAFAISDERAEASYASYDVEIRVTAGGVSTTRTLRVLIERCNPVDC